MTKPLTLHPDRLFPAEPTVRDIARRLYAGVADLPIVSPHGHTDPAWFATNAPFSDPSSLLIVPDHYVFRMLFSQGTPLEALGVPTVDGSLTETDSRKIWHVLANNYHLFRGTPSRMWLDWVFANVFGLDVLLEVETADLYYDTIDAALKTDAFRPRALFERFNIEAIATTESPLDGLAHHAAIRASGWGGRVVTAYRPDPVVDPEATKFADNVRRLARPPARTFRLTKAISPRTASTARASAKLARPRPTTDTRRHAPPISRSKTPPRSMCACWRARPRRMPSCSARKCSPKWHG